MSKLLKLLSLIICISFLLAGCKKNNTPAPFINYLKGKIDGVAFECNTNMGANPPSSTGDSYLNIRGAWPGGSIKLEIHNSGRTITPGEYKFKDSTVWRGTIYIPELYSAGSGALTNLSGSGKITILEISNDFVKGSFEFTTGPYFQPPYSVKTVTNGEFHIKRSY